jgi:hypothetical protein
LALSLSIQFGLENPRSFNISKSLSAPPLIVNFARNANIKERDALNVGATAITQQNGTVILGLPYGAGQYTSYACTYVRVARNELVRGALKLILEVDQVSTPECFFTQYRSSYRIRPFKNSNSAIEFHAGVLGDTQIGVVTGTAGVITQLPNGVVAFGLARSEPESKMQVTASNGQTANILPGQVALASRNGVTVVTPDAPTFTVFWGGNGNGKIFAPEGVLIEVNGQPVKPGAWISQLHNSTVQVTNLAGDEVSEQVFWPNARPRNQR